MPTYAHLLILVLLIFLSLFSHAFSDRCHPNDKKALLEIKNALNNPYDLISWDPKVDCCHWLLVKCDGKTHRITQLYLSQSDLNRPIPTSVGNLKYLESLTFRNTNLTGPIPLALSKLSQLNFLDLRSNRLSGPVPSFLGQLNNLIYIDLSFNNLRGSIPGSLSKLPKLGGLFLDSNKLTGSIPESFADFRKKEFYLHLSQNQLMGEIPRKLGHTNFTWFDVSRNRLQGDISFLFGENKSIAFADFSRNMLQFDMSNVLYPESLSNLDLSHNRITGRLPEDFADLIGLNVSYNRLCGPIPTAGGWMQKFDYTAYFHNKCLCGAPLPKCKS